MSSLHTDVILFIYLFIFVFQESEDKRKASKERLTRATGNARRIGVARLCAPSSRFVLPFARLKNAKK